MNIIQNIKAAAARIPRPKHIRMNPTWAETNFEWTTFRHGGVREYKTIVGITIVWDETIETYELEY